MDDSVTSMIRALYEVVYVKSVCRYMGVSKDSFGGWEAKIRGVSIGNFDTEEEAALAFDHAAFRLRGRNAKLNFPNYSAKGELMSPDRPLTSHEKRVERGADAMDFGSGLCVGADTGELLAQSNKFIAPEENEEANMFQAQDGAHAFQQCPNVEFDWDAITPQEGVAVGNQGDAVKELYGQDDWYAIYAETQSSNFQTEKSPPHQETMEIEEDRLMLDHSHQLPIVEDSMHIKGLIVGAEKVDSYIHVSHKTCIAETSKEGKPSENEYSYDIRSSHFGGLRDDVTNLFNVSRSKFKRICRDDGIKRWRSCKKKLDSRRSSKLVRVSDEDPGEQILIFRASRGVLENQWMMSFHKKLHFAGDAAQELHVQDGYATNAETQSSNFRTEKSPPHQHTMHKYGLVVGAEKVDSCNHVLHKTCIEETSKEGKPSENEYSYDILSAHFGKLQDDVAKHFNVSRSKFKRICRDNGIKRWRSHKKKLDSRRSSKLGRVSDEDPSRTDSYCPGIPPLQDTDMITVKATYNEVAIKFELLDSSRMVDLEDSVIERLKVERDTFSIKYQDDEGDWVLIACDKDLQNCIKTSRLSEKTTIKMLVDRPIKHYAS
uniref:PB1 domain-containing protein n=1 Tax=Daucus carota subsp. sativus TaxID=79200 RepID=A0A175YJB8_DAUCS